MTLVDLQPKEHAIIAKVRGHGSFRKRIMEMGFIAGQTVEVIQRAPLQDPVEYRIMGYNVSLRNSEAQLVEVISVSETNIFKKAISLKTLDSDFLNNKIDVHKKNITLAFIGNPNSGKTTLFNLASGSSERVGNYSGVTVEAKMAHFKLRDYTFDVTDLPGTYSLTAFSPEELYVRKFILNQMPDIVVNVVDASNLERNLFLTTQLIDMDIKVIVAFNMYDELLQSGATLDYERLGKLLGIPFIPTIGSKGKGINDLLEKAIEVYEDKDETLRHIHIYYGETLESAIGKIQDKLYVPCNRDMMNKVSSRFLSIKMIEKDADIQNMIANLTNGGDILETAQREVGIIENTLSVDSEAAVTDAKYGFIAGALKETYTPPTSQNTKSKSDRIDTVLTHKIWGIPIFVVFMALTFYITFFLGVYPQGWIENSVGWLSVIIGNNLTDGMLKDLLIDGILGGVGGVIVFLPFIVLLYFFISIMEDTGYMARAVFIMDKVMHKIGLHGKSMIPLLMGFGCNVPAILSTRIIESRNNRLVTMLITPFMSCTARLPVYILFIGALFSGNALVKGMMLFSLYAVGVLLAIITALLLNKLVFKVADVPFVMELPPYRIPTRRSVLKHLWTRTGQYLRKIGGIVLIASIIIWALNYFPRHSDKTNTIQAQIDQLDNIYSDANIAEKAYLTTQIDSLHKEMKAAHQEYSYIGHVGRFIMPVLKPLGFDWKMSIAIITGVAAKELTMGTLGVLYHVEEVVESPTALEEKIQAQVYTSGEKLGQKIFTPLVGISFMMFVLIYFPCIAVIAAIKKESGSWKWAIFTIFYTCAWAYLMSFAVYKIGGLFY